jgi:hypothetical protein
MESASGKITKIPSNHIKVIRAHCPKSLCNPCDSIPKQDVQSVVFEFDEALAFLNRLFLDIYAWIVMAVIVRY